MLQRLPLTHLLPRTRQLLRTTVALPALARDQTNSEAPTKHGKLGPLVRVHKLPPVTLAQSYSQAVIHRAMAEPHSEKSQEPAAESVAASLPVIAQEPAVPAAASQPAAALAPPAAPALQPAIFPAPLLDPLLSMGFSRGRAQRGLQATGATSVEAAMLWCLEHADDAGVDELLMVPAQNAVVAGQGVNAGPAAASQASSNADLFSSLPAGTAYKLVLVVRTDLHMRQGKIAAQVAHAAVGTVLDLQENAQAASREMLSPAAAASASPAAIRRANSLIALHQWLEQGQAKVVLQVGSLAEMHALAARAKAAGVATHIVADAGRTQIAAGSETVLAVGPAPIAVVDAITGHLKLL
jgi:PTH2 family peptidyl-tRNA hydrolase